LFPSSRKEINKEKKKEGGLGEFLQSFRLLDFIAEKQERVSAGREV
jgi:hypothetical protein